MDLNDYPLDILGQQPLMKIYTQICFCYPVDDTSSYSSIVATLTRGLESLSHKFPWLAGQVIQEEASEGSSGVMKIKPLDSIPRLTVKYLREDASMPTMEALRKAKFPICMLDEEKICPVKTLAGNLDVFPVLVIQATFITGGLMLTINAEHGTMDMTGQAQVIRLLSKACGSEPFTSEELSIGNLDRRYTIPLLEGDSYKDSPVLARQIVKPPSADVTPPPPPNSTWASFTFPSSSLAALKSIATQTIPNHAGFVSTDDALSAFIWQATTRARIHRLDPASESTFARAVDVRPFLNVPKTYPGLVQNMAFNTLTFQQLASAPLGEIAAHLRSALDRETLAHNTRVLATAMDRAADKSVFSVTATLDFGKDIMLSSWARENCYDVDFGLGLGKPESVRRPHFTPVESLMYILPKALDGEITVAICLRDEDMERLKVDEEFMKYGTYLG